MVLVKGGNICALIQVLRLDRRPSVKDVLRCHSFMAPDINELLFFRVSTYFMNDPS